MLHIPLSFKTQWAPCDDSGSTHSLPPINNCSQLSCHRCIATKTTKHGLVVQAQQAKAWALPLGPLCTHFSLPPPCTDQVPGLFTMLQHTNKQACSCCSQLSIMRLRSLHRHVDTTPAAKSATATTNRQLTCSCWKMISSRPQPQASQHCPLITTQNMPACSSLPKLLQTFLKVPCCMEHTLTAQNHKLFGSQQLPIHGTDSVAASCKCYTWYCRAALTNADSCNKLCRGSCCYHNLKHAARAASHALKLKHIHTLLYQPVTRPSC